jgi:hypothetical protein
MSKAFEKAEAHFRKRLSSVRIIEVPEWGEDDQPLKMHVRPLTMAEKDEILQETQKAPYRGVVKALIVRARDEEGKHIFDKAELGELMKKADPDVISRVVREMNDEISDEASEVEDAKKP